jgi:hypothetical protein
MGIFDIFKKKPQKNKYHVLYDSIGEIIKLLERKKRLVENLESSKSILDLEFDVLMLERMKLAGLIKNGSISFLGKDFLEDILDLFNNEETKKDNVLNIWNYLTNEQKKLRKLFEN